jgi:adenosylcobinamide-GDP ribazoletransferase
MKKLHPFVAALYFLTSIPVTKEKVSLQTITRALWTFPFVGLFIGVLLSLVSCLRYIFFPGLLTAALILAAWVWITGALHVDGFIDCCDALLCPRTKKERLAILKDVSTGSFGVAGALLLFLVKFSTLISITPRALLIALPLAAVSGRSAILYVMYRFPPARSEGLGASFKKMIRKRDLVISLVLFLVISFVCPFFQSPLYLGIVVLGVCIVFLELFGHWVLRRIPGFTGDVYGAACELTEAAVLITTAVVVGGAG